MHVYEGVCGPYDEAVEGIGLSIYAPLPPKQRWPHDLPVLKYY